MACDAPCDAGSVMVRLYLFRTLEDPPVAALNARREAMVDGAAATPLNTCFAIWERMRAPNQLTNGVGSTHSGNR